MQWWQEFGTKATFDMPSSIGVVDSLLPDLILTLACTERLTSGTNNSNGIHDLASQGVKPPIGHRKVYLDNVDLTLAISTIRRDEARESPTEIEQSFSGDTELFMLVDKNENDFSLFEDVVDGHNAELDQQLHARQDHFSKDQHIALTELERSWQEPPMNSNHSQKSFLSSSNYPHTPIPLTLAKNDFANSTASVSRDISVEHCSGLMDAALRRTLGGNDKCLARGVRALNSPKILTLAAIAPALFNPCYQQVSTCGVAQDICFHTMASN